MTACMQVVWHFRHDVVALLTGTAGGAGQANDSGKSDGGFFSRKSRVRAPHVSACGHVSL